MLIWQNVRISVYQTTLTFRVWSRIPCLWTRMHEENTPPVYLKAHNSIMTYIRVTLAVWLTATLPLHATIYHLGNAGYRYAYPIPCSPDIAGQRRPAAERTLLGMSCRTPTPETYLRGVRHTV